MSTDTPPFGPGLPPTAGVPVTQPGTCMRARARTRFQVASVTRPRPPQPLAASSRRPGPESGPSSSYRRPGTRTVALAGRG
eukprot:693919-Rhodomonas_salina.1